MDASEEVFQLVEVKRRIAEVESGRVELVSGDEVLVRARLLLAALSDEDEWVTEALRRDAEIESNASAGLSLAELDSYTQSGRKCVRAADDRE